VTAGPSAGADLWEPRHQDADPAWGRQPNARLVTVLPGLGLQPGHVTLAAGTAVMRCGSSRSAGTSPPPTSPVPPSAVSPPPRRDSGSATGSPPRSTPCPAPGPRVPSTWCTPAISAVRSRSTGTTSCGTRPDGSAREAAWWLLTTARPRRGHGGPPTAGSRSSPPRSRSSPDWASAPAGRPKPASGPSGRDRPGWPDRDRVGFRRLPGCGHRGELGRGGEDDPAGDDSVITLSGRQPAKRHYRRVAACDDQLARQQAARGVLSRMLECPGDGPPKPAPTWPPPSVSTSRPAGSAGALTRRRCWQLPRAWADHAETSVWRGRRLGGLAGPGRHEVVTGELAPAALPVAEDPDRRGGDDPCQAARVDLRGAAVAASRRR
jgi:hypothetical protein